MKELRGNLINSSTITVLVINVISFFVFYQKGIEINLSVLLGLTCMNIFFWIVFHQSFHYFQYNNKKLTVKNSVMPFIEKEYLLTEIEHVYAYNVGHLGWSLVLELRTGRKKAWGASDCSKSDLEEFAKYLNEQIEQESQNKTPTETKKPDDKLWR